MARMQHFTRDELKRLLSTIRDGHKLSAARLKLMVLVSFWHGLRITEAITLTGAQVRDGYLDVQRLKKSQHTIQKLIRPGDPDLEYADALEALAREVGPEGRLFPLTRFGAYYFMQRTGKRAGLPKHKCKPHTLKHSVAMQMIKTAGIENVRQHLGHKHGASTLEYLKVTDDEANEAIQQAAAVAAGK